MRPLHLTDGYKLDHRRQYPNNTLTVYSNWTPRKSRKDGINQVVFFGLQYFVKEYLINQFNANFFKKPKEEVVKAYVRRVNNYLGDHHITFEHVEALHDLGYLPIEIKALPEGTVTPIRVPMFTMVNTLPEFFWLTNYFETLVSNVVWLPCTSATIAYGYKKVLTDWAEKTGGDLDFVQFQGHDFSMRGMAGIESAMMSGAGHLLSFVGTDTIPSIDFLEDYYNADSDNELVGCSIAATEHSVMCMGGDGLDEFETFKRLITEVYPNGFVSIVSDTWDLWKVCSEFLPALKETILAREGKVVIRPDSGDPVDIICGKSREFGKGTTHEEKGVIELLWDTFGGEENDEGYKVLDSHIGAIYGDSITIERANAICERLAEKGFASTNVVFGIGSYTYQYNTRDTFGFAMKATYGEVGIWNEIIDNPAKNNPPRKVMNVEGREIYKDPITDDGTKKSAKGLLKVHRNEYDNQLELIDCVSWDQEKEGELRTIFKDGELIVDESLSEIRERVSKEKFEVELH
jgi:nicotinamide phosphoribosyltransferase